MFEMVDAATAEHNLEDEILSVNHVRRKRVEFSAEAVKNSLLMNLQQLLIFTTTLGWKNIQSSHSLFW